MKRLGLLCCVIMIATLVVGCGATTPEVMEVEKVITQVVQETVKETVIVAGTPEIVEKEVTSVVVVTATPEPEADEEGGSGGTLVIGMTEEVEFTNVMYTQGGNSLMAAKLAQRGLLFLDENSNWIGELAAEVPSLANGGVSEDGLTITYKLREGVTFHDGFPVTSADVKATWEAIMSPDNTPITRFGYDKIASIDTPDDYTVIMNYAEPFAAWPLLFDFIIPKHVIEENSPGLDESEAMRQPIGFGPFKFVEWKPGDYIAYEAFEDYWRGAPKIDRLVLQVYKSVEAELQAIKAGEIDVAWGLSTSVIPQIRDMEPDGVNLVTVYSSRYDVYTMNPDEPLFADRNVRLAIHHAIDRDLLIEKLLFGEGKITNSPWANSPWENTNLESYEYDLDKSRRLLDDAGWKDEDGDGIREAHSVEGVEDGTPFAFLHLTWCGASQQADMQLFAQQMLKEVGIDMAVDCRRSAELFGTWSQNGVWSHGEFQMAGWVHGLRTPDPEISNRYLCSEIASEENSAGSQWHRYCNPAVDELLLAQAQEFDAEKRTELLFQAQELMHEDAYMIYPFSAPGVYAIRAEVQNMVVHPFAALYWNTHEWALE